ncbi:leucine-rich repeat-containing protein 15-like [Agrilus planipennis]|uniref:Leucine-rich repeat-containing protein 15-like n=1 Tax=Agrilus planipennis TaxID=224129 RepID=A0A1W4WC25_AGRPL|nr:leucine-rich repeat-containing protein 15-like [Agrilus planipennis]
MNKLLTTFLICLCLCTIIKGQVCEKGRQSYLFKTFVMSCKNIRDQFPNTTSVASSISCENCDIPTFTEDVVVTFNGGIFDVSNSHIKNITENAFKNFGNAVQKLIFANNQISYIAPHVFDKFNNLEDLNLHNNSLSNVLPGVFENLTIGVFDLSNNNISDVTNFIRKIKVRKLDLSNNKLTQISINMFNDTSFWVASPYRAIFHELNIGNNQIESIQPGSFKFGDGNSLRVLYLQNNKITVILNNTFSLQNELKNLILNSNQINSLETDSFNNLPKLIMLDLAKNKLATLPFGVFSKLGNLETLNLESNQLSKLDPSLFSGLVRLNRLHLAHNKLTQFSPTTIFPLGKLTYLDVSDNRLRELDLKAIYSHQTRLSTLIINDNFWSCSKLVAMYKVMNAKWGGFHDPAKHFDVPNLHGIACSRVELDYDENLTFAEFMNIISQDRVFEDIYDSRINGDAETTQVSLDHLYIQITGMFWMFLSITIMCTVFFVHFVIVTVKSNKIIANKLNFSYSRAQDENVQLM